MARTWTQIAQDTTIIYSSNADICYDNDYVYYFVTDATGFAVNRWSLGGGFEDISGTTFDVANYEPFGMAIFGDELYIIYVYDASDHARVARWDGDTDWTVVLTLTDEDAGALTIYRPVSKVYRQLTSDENVLLTSGLGTKDTMFWSTDGTSWNRSQIAGNWTFGYSGLSRAFSLYEYALYQIRKNVNPPHDEDFVYYHDGTRFVQLNNDDDTVDIDVGNRKLRGCGGDNLVFADVGLYSFDWLVNVTDGGDSNWTFAFTDKDIYTVSTDNVFIWNSATLTWDSDGDLPNDNDTGAGLFWLGTTLYVLGDDNLGSGNVTIWAGGALNQDPNAARFYHGLGTLVEKFSLPFPGVEPGGMTLDKSLGTVVAGSNQPAAVMGIYSTYPYPDDIAMTDGIPTGSAVTSVKWI